MFWFSLQLLAETFLILRKLKRDMITNVRTSSCKAPVIRVRFWWKSYFPRQIFEKYSNITQMKHQLDATLCRFYFCRVTLHVSGASAHHQEYLKLVLRPLVHVLSLQVSHHISLLGPFGPNKEMWWLTCNDNTCTSGCSTSFKYSWWWALEPETCRVTLQK